MDSLTQFALGGIVGCATLRDTSKQTILISGLVATIPDLDVFLKPFYADGNFVLVHRSFSHSLLCTVILSSLLAQFSFKDYVFWKKFKYYFLVLFTHALLDCCTTYGTQLFWPFDRRLISFNNIHVLEPVYTLLLVIPLLIIGYSKQVIGKKLKWVYASIVLSTAYLGWTYLSKSIATKVVTSNLAQQHIAYEDVRLTPTPLNSLLWKAIVKKGPTYHFGSYSLLDKTSKISFHKRVHQPELLKTIENYCDTQTMLKHCDGFPFVEKVDEKINIYAVKFGPANYVGEPVFIMPFQAQQIGSDDFTFKIIDNRFEAGKLNQYHRELLTRIRGK